MWVAMIQRVPEMLQKVPEKIRGNLFLQGLLRESMAEAKSPEEVLPRLFRKLEKHRIGRETVDIAISIGEKRDVADLVPPLPLAFLPEVLAGIQGAKQFLAMAAEKVEQFWPVVAVLDLFTGNRTGMPLASNKADVASAEGAEGRALRKAS